MLLFVLTASFLCITGATVYANVWHEGFLFLAWLFAIWIAAARIRPGRAAVASLTLVIAVQCYWTARSVGYDWARPYSGSKAAAAFLQRSGIAARRLYGLGFVSTAVQPYFTHNVFRNFNGGGPAYWDWSTRNSTDDAAALFLPDAPAYVLAGYKTAAERERWTTLMRLGGYAHIEHFDGNVYWRTSILQPESFDLYRGGARPADPSAVSVVTMADPNSARQLLSGFYSVEANAWRWTARNFEALLKPPPGAGRNGATLLLRLFLPDSQIAKLGPMTLTANINGHPLPPETFTQKRRRRLLGPGSALCAGRRHCAREFQLRQSLASHGGRRAGARSGRSFRRSRSEVTPPQRAA